MHPICHDVLPPLSDGNAAVTWNYMLCTASSVVRTCAGKFLVEAVNDEELSIPERMMSMFVFNTIARDSLYPQCRIANP